MTPMEPLPETVEAVNELDPSADDHDLLADLTRLANRARELVPDLVGVSVAGLDGDLTFTLVASDEEIAVLDAVQYAAGGPCVEGAQADAVLELVEDELLDEERWRLFSQATAARTVRSTLTLPIVGDVGRVVGTVNLYGASGRAFVGHHAGLAEVFGAWAPGAVANADLSFSTRHEAHAAPGRVRDRVIFDVATGILAAVLGVDVEAAAARMREAALRAGVEASALAREIIRAREYRDAPEE